MFDAQLLYGFTGALLFGLGARSVLLHPLHLGRIIAFNIAGLGLFLMFVAIAYRGPELPPDAVPHALVLTGIVVAVSATAFALTLARRIETSPDNPDDSHE
jgi:multicomponent Na+:H+ antiporter subunit C